MMTIMNEWSDKRSDEPQGTTCGRMNNFLLILMGAVILLGLPGCISWGTHDRSEASQETAETAIDREVAELVKLYRMCLQKNEDNPVKARENCGMYKEAIRDLSPASLRTVVGELLDGIRDNCETQVTPRDSGV
jgi:hypothetical protein